MSTELETKLTDWITAHPNKWREAVANPNLRGAVVASLTGRNSSAVDRAEAARIIDRRADEQSATEKDIELEQRSGVISSTS